MAKSQPNFQILLFQLLLLYSQTPLVQAMANSMPVALGMTMAMAYLLECIEDATQKMDIDQTKDTVLPLAGLSGTIAQ